METPRYMCLRTLRLAPVPTEMIKDISNMKDLRNTGARPHVVLITRYFTRILPTGSNSKPHVMPYACSRPCIGVVIRKYHKALRNTFSGDICWETVHALLSELRVLLPKYHHRPQRRHNHCLCIMHEPRLDINEPYPWLRSIYQDATIVRIKGAPEAYQDTPQRFVRISFSELQRLHLRKLQCKLAQHAVKIRFDDVPDADEPKDWEEDLKSYSKSTCAHSKRQYLPCGLK